MNLIRTLIVEDDPMVAQLNQHYLNQIEGFKFIMNVGSVDEGIKILQDEVIDLILLDTYMPEKNGFELVKYIRQQELNVDIIFITAARDVESVKKAIQYGVVDYLIKPFTFERFTEALLNYRKRISLMKELNILDQQKIDTLLEKEDQLEMRELPKGLTKKTLKCVWDSIITVEDESFSTEEIAKRVGLSRVSIGKYLHFLEDEGLLRVKIEYGYIGRPMTKFQCIDKREQRIQAFL